MADAITIIGTVGAVANIIDLVSKTINGIRDVRGRWKEADLAFLSLAAQLTALRAALGKIKEWSDQEMAGDPDYQLIMDLDVSMSCCRLLAGKFDDFFFKLNQTTDEALDFASKVKFVFGTRDLDDVQRMVERQISVLTLLLTACNCNTSSEQKSLLRNSKTRRVITRIGVDSASLFVQRDSSSFISRWSDNLSKFSIQFDFDRELFITKVYEKVIRSSVMNSLRQKHELTRPAEDSPNSLRQKHELTRPAEDSPNSDAARIRRERKVLLVGSADSCKDQIVKQLKIIYQNGYSTEELMMYRSIVYGDVIACAKAVVDAMEVCDIRPELDPNHSHCSFLQDYTIDPDPDKPLDSTVGDAVNSLRRDPCFEKVMERSDELYSMDSAPYFFGEIKRIAAPNYIPTEADMLRCRTRSSGVQETRFIIGQESIHLIDVGSQRSDRKKWIHTFEDVISIIFVVDLACYDSVLPEESSANKMMEQLLLFESVANSACFMRTSIILFVENVGVFKQKLSRSPLADYFPDYTGGDDLEKAAKYLLWRFNQVNRAHLNLYWYLTDPYDASNIRLVFTAIQETILNKCLRKYNPELDIK